MVLWWVVNIPKFAKIIPPVKVAGLQSFVRRQERENTALYMFLYLVRYVHEQWRWFLEYKGNRMRQYRPNKDVDSNWGIIRFGWIRGLPIPPPNICAGKQIILMNKYIRCVAYCLWAHRTKRHSQLCARVPRSPLTPQTWPSKPRLPNQSMCVLVCRAFTCVCVYVWQLYSLPLPHRSTPPVHLVSLYCTSLPFLPSFPTFPICFPFLPILPEFFPLSIMHSGPTISFIHSSFPSLMDTSLSLPFTPPSRPYFTHLLSPTLFLHVSQPPARLCTECTRLLELTHIHIHNTYNFPRNWCAIIMPIFASTYTTLYNRNLTQASHLM